MLLHSNSLKATALAIGAAACVAWAPIASADDPPQCDQNDQQCQDQQNPGAGAAQRAIDEAKKGLDQANKGSQPDNGARNGDLADKNCWVIDGVPTWNAPGTAPRATGPGQSAVPCYYVYGLQPH